MFNMAFLQLLSERMVRLLVRKFMSQSLYAKICKIGFFNLGSIDERKLDFGYGPCRNAFFLPPTGDPPLLLGCVSGCGGKIFMGIGYRPNAISPEVIDTILDEIDGELKLLEQR
jgi:hypothetical protein